MSSTGVTRVALLLGAALSLGHCGPAPAPTRDPPPSLLPAVREVLEPDAERGWRLKPARRPYRIAAPGFRGVVPAADRGPRDLVIACLGDDRTFGSTLRYEHTYGLRLERALQRQLPGGRVQVLLAAVPGYSTGQSQALYRELVAPLRPDLTVFLPGT